jgi:fumarylacetoacetase
MTLLGQLDRKGFVSSISLWIITLDALQNVTCTSTAADLFEGGSTRAAHLCHTNSDALWNLEVEVSMYSGSFEEIDSANLLTMNREMTSYSIRNLVSIRFNLRDLRWSLGQILAHLASSGSELQTGDLIGTGTILSLVRENVTRFTWLVSWRRRRVYLHCMLA